MSGWIAYSLTWEDNLSWGRVCIWRELAREIILVFLCPTGRREGPADSDEARASWSNPQRWSLSNEMRGLDSGWWKMAPAFCKGKENRALNWSLLQRHKANQTHHLNCVEQSCTPQNKEESQGIRTQKLRGAVCSLSCGSLCFSFCCVFWSSPWSGFGS